MAWPVVIATNGFGIPVTEATNGFGIPYEIATNGFGTPVVFTTNGMGIPIVQGGGSPTYAARVEPATADMFYLIMRAVDGITGKVSRFQRNVGGSGGTDLGGLHLEFRLTGEGTMAAFNGSVATTVWQSMDDGATDFVARRPDLTFFGSYHGLGAGGSLSSETMTMDGVAISHTVASYGTTFVLRNTTTATDGTNILTRDLSITSKSDASLDMELMSGSASGTFDLAYFAMLIGSGDGYDELQVRHGTTWNVIPLGTTNAQAVLANRARAVKHRDTTNGNWVMMSGALPDVANFQRARTLKEPANQRTKTYVGQFSTPVGLAGAKVNISWGVGATGVTTPAANQLADDAWTVPPWAAYSQTNGIVVKSGADLTMTWTTGTANLRVSAPTTSLAAASPAYISVDYVSRTATGAAVTLYVSLTGNSTTNPAMSITPVLGRNIEVFDTTQDSATGQRFALRQEGSANQATVWRNPAIRALAA